MAVGVRFLDNMHILDLLVECCCILLRFFDYGGGRGFSRNKRSKVRDGKVSYYG